MTSHAHPLANLTRWLSVGSLLGLIVLSLAWELWLAPLRPGGSWWVIKALPLCLPLIGLLKHRLYTYRWVTLVVWLYFAEGVIRLYSDPWPSRLYASLEVLLCLVLFSASAMHVRWRLQHAKTQVSAHSVLLDRLRAICGDDHVLTGEGLVAFERDWRGREQGRALCVVRPARTEEVSQVVKACVQANVPMVPQGGNTGLVMGSTPDTSGHEVVINLQRMQQVRHIDVANATLTADAGCVLQHLQEKADEAGFLFPLSLASEGSCTLGGNLASNAGGTQVLRYGNARELCLGLEVVTAQGEVLQGLSGLRKDNTGYDLKQLYIGSEGTLGILTAATVKLFPKPAAQRTAWASLADISQASVLLGLAQQHLGAGLTGFELMSQMALSLVAKHFPALTVPFWQQAPYAVLLELSDTESDTHATERLEQMLGLALQDNVILDVVVAQSLSQSRELWRVRESISAAQAAEGLNIKHDISLPVSAIPDFVAHTNQALTDLLPGIRVVHFGHWGDGNLHYNVQCPESTDAASFLTQHEPTVNTLVYDAVQRWGGSISAEHGIGRLKVDELPRYKDKVAMQLMGKIKQALDPLNLMNPGRVINLSKLNEPID